MHLIPYKLKNDWTWIKQARQGARWEHLAKSAEVLAMLVCFYFFSPSCFFILSMSGGKGWLRLVIMIAFSWPSPSDQRNGAGFELSIVDLCSYNFDLIPYPRRPVVLLNSAL